MDILACNSANKPSFQNSTKTVFAQCSIDVKSALTFTEPAKKVFCRILTRWLTSWITDQNVQRLQIFAVFASFLWGNLKVLPPCKFSIWHSQKNSSLDCISSSQSAWMNGLPTVFLMIYWKDHNNYKCNFLLAFNWVDKDIDKNNWAVTFTAPWANCFLECK